MGNKKKLGFMKQFIKQLLLNLLDSNMIFISCGKFPDTVACGDCIIYSENSSRILHEMNNC